MGRPPVMSYVAGQTMTAGRTWTEVPRSQRRDSISSGVPFLSGITSMLVLGAGRDAEMVVRQLAGSGSQQAARAAVAG